VSRDYIEEAQHEARLRFGRELAPEELAMKFAGHDIETRVIHLKTIRGDDEEISLGQAEKALERAAHVRALHSMHERLRKVDR
jgi:hypothetical protein